MNMTLFRCWSRVDITQGFIWKCIQSIQNMHFNYQCKQFTRLAAGTWFEFHDVLQMVTQNSVKNKTKI